jgi:hypothetical protein
MAYNDVPVLAASASFMIQSKVAMIRYATFIGGITTVNDEKTALAVAILRNPSAYTTVFADSVANYLETLGQFPTPTDAQVYAATQIVFLATARR